MVSGLRRALRALLNQRELVARLRRRRERGHLGVSERRRGRWSDPGVASARRRSTGDARLGGDDGQTRLAATLGQAP